MTGNQKNRIRDNTFGHLLIFSVVVYLISFFLPAYSESLYLFGYECALIAFGIVIGVNVDIEGGNLVQLYTRMHFLLLGLHNLIVPACVLLNRKIITGQFRWLFNIFAISSVNTVLFFLTNHFSAEMDGEALLAGYYVWVFASLMILVILKRKQQIDQNA